MKKIRVVTTTKGQTYDPAGRAVVEALQQLGIKHIKDVKIGKHAMLIVDEDAPEEEIHKNVVDAAEKLLHNNIIEDYEILND